MWRTVLLCLICVTRSARTDRDYRSGEDVCEGHGYAKRKCASFGCCKWDGKYCWSMVGDGPCRGDGDEILKARCEDRTLSDGSTWRDTNGDGCSKYVANNWCPGTTGEGYDYLWPEEDLSATNSCCGCGGGVKFNFNADREHDYQRNDWSDYDPCEECHAGCCDGRKDGCRKCHGWCDLKQCDSGRDDDFNSWGIAMDPMDSLWVEEHQARCVAKGFGCLVLHHPAADTFGDAFQRALRNGGLDYGALEHALFEPQRLFEDCDRDFRDKYASLCHCMWENDCLSGPVRVMLEIDVQRLENAGLRCLDNFKCERRTMTGGAIAGIVVGTLAFCALLIVWYLRCVHRKLRDARNALANAQTRARFAQASSYPIAAAAASQVQLIRPQPREGPAVSEMRAIGAPPPPPLPVPPPPPATSTEQQLPPGWVKMTDQLSGQAYYYHPVLKMTQWTPPTM